MAGLSAGPHVVADYVNRELLLVLLYGSVASLPVWPLLREWAGRSREYAGTAGAALVELVRVAATAAMLAATTVQLTAGTYNPFIYFRFWHC